MTPGAKQMYRKDLSGDCLPPWEQLVQFLPEKVREEVAGLVSGQDQNNITIPESPDAIKKIHSDRRSAVATCRYYIKVCLERRGNVLRTDVAGQLNLRSLHSLPIHISVIRDHIASALDELRKLNNNSSLFGLTTDQLHRCFPCCEFTLLGPQDMVSALACSDVGLLEELLRELEHYPKMLEDPTARGIPGGDGGTDPTFPGEPLGLTAAGIAGERGDAGEPGLVEGECSPSRTRRGKNEERDKLVYKLCCDGIPYRNIRTRLQNEHPDWKAITSDSGVGYVAKTYATTHSLPPTRSASSSEATAITNCTSMRRGLFSTTMHQRQ